jgi:cobalt-zinc-cadmium efflux system protein
VAHDHAGHTHHHHHHHAPSADADRGALTLALALIAGFMGVEVVAGLLAGSLALLSDAAHMLTDAAAIGLALFAARLARRPPGGSFTFGLRRAEILSAQVNGAALLALALLLGASAIGRLVTPSEVEGGIVLVVGGIGAVVNVAAAWSLARSERQSLNVEGARMHVLADLFGSVGAITAGAVVLATGFDRADPIAALLVSCLMIRSSWSLLRESGRVLLEAAPRGTDVGVIGRALAEHPGVAEVHDLHVWEVTSGFPALAAHVMVPSGADCHAKRRELQELLRDRFHIEHTTLQVDHAPREALLEIEHAASPRQDGIGSA